MQDALINEQLKVCTLMPCMNPRTIIRAADDKKWHGSQVEEDEVGEIKKEQRIIRCSWSGTLPGY